MNDIKYFSATYGEAIKFDKKPNEDFYLVSKEFPIFAVADGVTRSHFQDGRYSFPEGARKSAQIFCKSVIEYLEANFEKDEEIFDKIKQAFDFANKKIKELNIEYGIDKKLNYVEYDWLDTVGIAGIILKDKLYYGYVGDCGLIIFDKDDKKKFKTADMVMPPVTKFRDTHKNWKNYSLNKRKYLIRTELRNNPNGQGYGTFSGEEGVKNYYVFGSKTLNHQDMAVFYSDGLAKYLENKKFVNILREGDKKGLNKFMFWKIIKNIFEYGSDRTFISLIFKEN
ncbi:MAG: protein phosphatase 2C domain-containing protein [Candidatus Staskawiczbacteria bacterium]|jgi:serine/threonine protein phosphatase PrpC